MEDSFGNRSLKSLPQTKMNFIDGYISSYQYILNLPKRIELIRQENKLASILCDLESDHTRGKEEEKKIATEAEENRRIESEDKQVR